MQNTKRLSELLNVPGRRLGGLKQQVAKRATVLAHVRAALPPRLAQSVVSAGIEDGRLTIGVTSAAWASRLRYCTEMIRKPVSEFAGSTVLRVRIRVLPPAT